MHVPRHPFTVRLVGFEPDESTQLEALLARAPVAGPSYSCLHDDSLQEPDLYIANGDSSAALKRLGCVPPSSLQPALVIGGGDASARPTMARPIEPKRLFDELAELLDMRVQALAELNARGERLLAERRRHPRLAPDTEKPEFYDRLRHGPSDGGVLIIDKECTFRDHVARVLGRRKLPVEWTDSLRAAMRLCDETPVSLVMINTSAVGVDPYWLCSSIKSQGGAGRTAVLFLVESSFQYDSVRARDAGVRGLLDKPVAGRHLMMTFQKLLDLPV
ncbi:response regulator [Massilia niastensis]|uniref:response regulator n=1 Tax=Massilia niastensis TaxID=544911 RepID=UPI0004756AB0|nr:response regulator [Massilia niastensis]